MNLLTDAVTGHFRRHDIPFVERPGTGIVVAPVPVHGGSYTCVFQIDERNGLVVIYSICPCRAADDRRAAVEDALTRANFGLPFGNFEMDMGDGSIRFKTAILSEERSVPGDGLVMHALDLNLRTHERYLPALQDVVYRDLAPAEAVERVENGLSGDVDRIVARLLETCDYADWEDPAEG